MLIESDDAVFQLVPRNLIVIWYGIEKLFEITSIKFSIPPLRFHGRRFSRCHEGDYSNRKGLSHDVNVDCSQGST